MDCPFIKNALESLFQHAMSSKESLLISIVSEHQTEIKSVLESVMKANKHLYYHTYMGESFYVGSSLVEFFSPLDEAKVIFYKRDILLCVNVDSDIRKELETRTTSYAISIRTPIFS